MIKNYFLIIPLLAVLSACASLEIAPQNCPEGTQALPNCPPMGAVDLPRVNKWYEIRTWLPASQREEDLLQIGIDAVIPVQQARVKVLATNDQDALYSLAAKLYMIEQAEHSVDAIYYIFRDDLAGLAMLGALCDAVVRGVDIRLMIDSAGTLSLNKNMLRALYSCQWDAGFVRDEFGKQSTRKARIQVVIFNPLSNFLTSPNRRSHDKLMVVDGFVPSKALVIQGGRNISLDYYGIHADGSPNPDTYMDAELLLRPLQNDVQKITVAEAAEIYFSLLAGFKGNRHIQTRISITGREGFAESRSKMRAGLREMKGLSSMSKALSAMPEYTSSGFIQSEVLLAHEFGNLVNKRVVTRALENQVKNPNSIMGMMRGLDTNDDKELTIVSPYLFMARYYDREGTVTLDEADELKRWLEADPDRVLNIVTNSVLTSDNFFAQAFVDMNMAPRMLLDDEDTMQAWLGKRQDGEQNVQLVESQVWLELVNNPRLRVYETGRLDDELLGGPQSYGKLHAKYFFSDDVGFVGTANFDYRSRLYNNEMGFFFRSPELLAYLKEDFELLRSKSYLWGSPEWLEMRNEVMGLSGMKGMTTRKQRSFYRFLKSTGLYWLF